MSAGLEADFEKRFAGGAVVRAALTSPAGGSYVTALFGPSGCGKTTTLRCLAGLERPERGHVHFGGEVWVDASRGIHLAPQRRGIGYLFQDYALFPHLSVARNVGYGLAELSRAQRRRRVDEVLEALGLRDLAQRRPAQLSGGQQQRTALARAVARRPRLLLLDEPLSALDAAARLQLRGELRRLLKAFEIPVIVVTHDHNEAIALADGLTVMEGGRVLQSGPVADVFARPAGAAVARIVGVETVQPGRIVEVSGGLATVHAGPAQLLAVAGADVGPEVYVCVRAEDVILQQGDAGLSSARNQLKGIVLSMSPDGPMIRVVLDCGFPLTALVTRPACAELGLMPGAVVTALVKAPSVHLVPRV